MAKYALERRGYSIETSFLRRIIASPKTDFDTFSGRTAFGKLTHDVFGQSFDNVLANEMTRNPNELDAHISQIRLDVQSQKERFQYEADVTFEMLEGMNIFHKIGEGTYEVPQEMRELLRHAQDSSFGMPSLYGFGEFNSAYYDACIDLKKGANTETVDNFILARHGKTSFQKMGTPDREKFKKLYHAAYGKNAPELTYKLYKSLSAVGRAFFSSGRNPREMEMIPEKILGEIKLSIADASTGKSESFDAMFGFILGHS